VTAGVVVLELAAAWFDSQAVPLAAMRVPYPHRILAAFIEFGPRLAEAAWVTLLGSLVGLAIGVAMGWLIALIVTQSRALSAVTEPYLIAAQMIPTVALAPIILAVLRDLALARVVVAAYLTLFTISLACIKGLQSARPEAVELMRSYAAGRWHVYRYLRIPTAMPFFFAGLRVAAPLAVVGEIVVELSSAQSGLGYLLLATLFFGIGLAYLFWATLLTTLLLGLGLAGAAAWLERRFAYGPRAAPRRRGRTSVQPARAASHSGT
jgi:NitT/TauT family transport system permease protein